MSILINGMEMPKNCAGCFLRVGQCSKRIYMENRPSDCPLNEVPEPHGRLIDEDVLIKTAHNQWPLPIDFLKLLELVPTVIPADGEDTNVTTREEGK